MRIIAVDPGLATGLAHGVSLLDGAFVPVDTLELSPFSAVQYVEEAIHLHYSDPVALVVCESFTPRAGVRTWQPDALEVIGALRYICAKAGVEFETQSPASAKRFSTNDKLTRLRWRNPTKGGHADDALRHLLLAAVRTGTISAEELLGAGIIGEED